MALWKNIYIKTLTRKFLIMNPSLDSKGLQEKCMFIVDNIENVHFETKNHKDFGKKT